MLTMLGWPCSFDAQELLPMVPSGRKSSFVNFLDRTLEKLRSKICEPFVLWKRKRTREHKLDIYLVFDECERGTPAHT